MDVVCAAPEVMGRQRQHADDPSYPIIRACRGKKRTMAAIVLDHEQADEEGGRRDDEHKSGPIARAHRVPQQDPGRGERNRRDQQLDYAAPGARCAIAAQNSAQRLRPGGEIDGLRLQIGTPGHTPVHQQCAGPKACARVAITGRGRLRREFWTFYMLRLYSADVGMAAHALII